MTLSMVYILKDQMNFNPVCVFGPNYYHCKVNLFRNTQTIMKINLTFLQRLSAISILTVIIFGYKSAMEKEYTMDNVAAGKKDQFN